MPLWKRIALWLEKPIMLVFRRHADYMIRMHASGQVADKRTRAPVVGAHIFFVDTSFDLARSKEPDKHALEIGVTGGDGKFDLTFHYVWSLDVVWLSKSRLGNSFQLKVERDGYAPAVLEFDPRALPYEDYVLQVLVPEVIGLDPTTR